jgi:UDP-N-acetylglucosamine--N-acetylmuramyl-(pentapeptide) pyrophosphoryl-undecaprenol N-acetylglucosamine transferase
VYPALTTWQAIKDKLGDSLETLWIGGIGGMEEDLVKRAGISFEAIPAAGVHGVGWRALPGNIMQLFNGFRKAREILRNFNPHILFFTGGFVAVPVAVASARLPKVLFVPDIEPGLALKTLARRSSKIALTVEDSKAYFPSGYSSRTTVTGYPIRPEIKTWSRQEALRELGLSQNLFTLLVSGGSKGARSINRALLPVLKELLPEMQIIHLTGNLDWEEVQNQWEALSVEYKSSKWLKNYHPYPYLHEMGAALAAADLVISRAGASSLGEYPYFGLPAILVPYPYAWRYQYVNAKWLESRNAAMIVSDEDLPDRLVPLVKELISEPTRLGAMKTASQSLSNPTAAEAIADLLIQEVTLHQRMEA